MGYFKFNVDGAAKGKPGPAGIGGILRDENGKVWLRFSKSIGITESNEAEIYAIREAMLIFSASRWVPSIGLMIESDSKNAVGWVEHPSDTPWRLRKWIAHISLLKKNFADFKIAHVYREANGDADELAKGGIDRLVPLLAIYD